MNLLLLGATGKTGTHALDLALARGHRVTAFVRSPAKIARQHALLRVVGGDPLDVDALSGVLDGHDAALSTLGLPPTKALRPATFMAEAAATTVAAMKRAGVPRLAILSAAVLFPGTGLTYGFFRWLLAHHARDLSAMETVVAASNLDWTIARPPRLVQDDDAGYRAKVDAVPDGQTTATFRGTAAFMLDALEKRHHLRAIVGVGRA